MRRKALLAGAVAARAGRSIEHPAFLLLFLLLLRALSRPVDNSSVHPAGYTD